MNTEEKLRAFFCVVLLAILGVMAYVTPNDFSEHQKATLIPNWPAR